ncbi:hypothetical protein BHYA_0337g00020 [Botrytis hyacinthi]|uniref:Cytochrome P450 n=1 Tax=Botrytis hyacinthi TaxID=278943 RepID=A0A4Z1G9V1_9HELO|nr:hypothetical protein BHYA_0337g00020 [Botrytis hyacinthi]
MAIVVYFLSSIALLVVVKLTYNIYFHPLASYSGPLYLIASDIPLAVLPLLGTSQYLLKAAHDKYGDIVRIAPGTLSYIKPQAWSNIYGYKPNGGDVANFPKDPHFYNEMMLGRQTITLASDEEAIPIRRSLNSAFSHRSLLEQETMMQQCSQMVQLFYLSNEVIEAQATVVILADSETSSVAETAAVYRILTHPDIYKKLRKEIRSSFASIENIKLQDVLYKLPYLEAVVQETLRIHAPLANGFTRWVPEKNGAIICGQHVPQGTVVTINHYCSNTSESNFRDPMSFIPERWMGDATYTNDKREVVQPFFVGPRNCPGQQFALYIIKLTLAHLIWRFDLELGEGTKNWAEGQRIYNG